MQAQSKGQPEPLPFSIDMGVWWAGLSLAFSNELLVWPQWNKSPCFSTVTGSHSTAYFWTFSRKLSFPCNLQPNSIRAAQNIEESYGGKHSQDHEFWDHLKSKVQTTKSKVFSAGWTWYILPDLWRFVMWSLFLGKVILLVCRFGNKLAEWCSPQIISRRPSCQRGCIYFRRCEGGRRFQPNIKQGTFFKLPPPPPWWSDILAWPYLIRIRQDLSRVLQGQRGPLPSTAKSSDSYLCV